MTSNPTIYLDHNATTPLAPEVLQAMSSAFSLSPANPSSVHALGRRARVELERARERVAAVLGDGAAGTGRELARGLVFTGSGTEANNLALLGCCSAAPGGARHSIAISRVEHPSILGAARLLERRGWSIRHLPVNARGCVDLESAAPLMDETLFLVSVMLANNEVGSLQPIRRLAELAHQAGALFHTDAIQALGKMPIDVKSLGIDLLSVSAHKIHGPPGIGALWIAPNVDLEPLLVGGAQEDGRRAGTENLPAIVGFAAACELFARNVEPEAEKMRRLRARLVDDLRESVAGIRFYGQEEGGLPNTLSLALPNFPGDELLVLLDLEGVYVSTGSACSSGSMGPSHVLLAMGFSEEEARRVVRLSLGRGTTREELERLVELLASLARH